MHSATVEFEGETYAYMDIGFTGTRQGMTGLQINEFHRIIQELDTVRFVHGACHDLPQR